MNNEKFLSVNFHVWEPCNMRCKFCIAAFQDVKQTVLPLGHLPKDRVIQVVKVLAFYGFQKITFAGGEPTLCPWLPDLIKTAKQYGMTNMVVTNGSGLDEVFFVQNRDFFYWIALSIDSLNPETNIKLGRAIGVEKLLNKDYYESLVVQIRKYGFGLKINTVVNRVNLNEDLS